MDGRTEHPHLYAKPLAWVEKRAATWPENVQVHVAGTETRLGKMMAVEAGLDHMRELVASGHPSHARFPDLYFSIDGDGTLDLIAAAPGIPAVVTLIGVGDGEFTADGATTLDLPDGASDVSLGGNGS